MRKKRNRLVSIVFVFTLFIFPLTIFGQNIKLEIKNLGLELDSLEFVVNSERIVQTIAKQDSINLTIDSLINSEFIYPLKDYRMIIYKKEKKWEVNFLEDIKDGYEGLKIEFFKFNGNDDDERVLIKVFGGYFNILQLLE